MVAIPDTGELDQIPLPRILIALSQARFDGCLRLRRDRTEKTFLFQRGAPISAESNLAGETLGLQLVDSGRLGREDHHRVSRYVAERKVKEGVAMLELGLLDPKSLFLALKEQVRLRLVDCFGWSRGSYEIERQETPPQGAQPFRADLYALIQEGIETHWNAERVLADLGPRMNETVVRNRVLSQMQAGCARTTRSRR